MDPKEASAMTEASGLIDELRDSDNNRPTIETDMHRPKARISEQLRQMTLAAPLPSLFVAFLVGIWLARRR
jgi:ABC-type uncharacterized transport system involved in gliding motility auxiliary subunit